MNPDADREEFLKYVEKEMKRIQWATRKLAWTKIYFLRNPPWYCDMCKRKSYCRRLCVNGMIQRMALKGEICPDIWTVWNEVFI